MVDRMNKSHHTPTPWLVDEPWQIWAESIGEYVAITDVEGDGRTPYAANAEYIVRCVNSHDDLVEALQDLYEWLDSTQLGELPRASLSKAKAALKKASE
jgi:hypothetical protein